MASISLKKPKWGVAAWVVFTAQAMQQSRHLWQQTLKTQIHNLRSGRFINKLSTPKNLVFFSRLVFVFPPLRHQIQPTVQGYQLPF